MLTEPNRFAELVAEHMDKLSGAMFHGPAEPCVARLVLVACGPTTLDHFATTAMFLRHVP